MPTIGFLHTSDVHTAVFEALVAEVAATTAAPLAVVSAVDTELLAVARRLGPEHPDVVAGLAARLAALGDAGADVVVCTCSTIGGSAESVGAALGTRTVRVDRPMAELAVATGGRIVVLAALESTLAPTRALLASVAADRGADVEIDLRLVEGAWERFEAGDSDGYLDAVAGEIATAADQADVVVLAQASMADATGRVESGTTDVPVLSSPRPAVEAVVGGS